MSCNYCCTRFILNKNKRHGTPFQMGADGYGKCMIVEDTESHEFYLIIPYDAEHCYASCQIDKCPFCGDDLSIQEKVKPINERKNKMIKVKLELEYNGGDYTDFYNAMKELQQGIDDIDNMSVKFCSTEEIADETKK